MTSRSDLLVEEVLSGNLVNPRTGHKSRTFSIAGKADLVDISNGILIDWKTVADPIKYVKQKSLGYQAEIYAFMLKERGIKINTIEYRLIKKPTIRLKKDESPAEFVERCVEWITDDPMNMISHEVFIDAGRISEAQSYLWATARAIRNARKDNYWARNERACWAWNRPCDYLPLCELKAAGQDTSYVASEEFDQAKAHTELDDDNKDALTYSSTTCFLDCPQKYAWRYEEKLRPKRDEIGGALWVGSLVHDALETLLKEGMNEAMNLIDTAINEIPFLGEDEWKKLNQEGSKAKAIVMSVPQKWSV